MPVIHEGIYKPNVFGGVTTTTLCGRVSNACDDGMNVGDAVTCKFCLRILKTPNHYNAKWIGWHPALNSEGA